MMVMIIIIIIISLFALGRIFRANAIVAEQMHEPNNLNQTWRDRIKNPNS